MVLHFTGTGNSRHATQHIAAALGDELLSMNDRIETEPDIDRAISAIADGQAFPPPRYNLYDRFMSGPVNPIFYSFFVKAKAFTAGDACTGCGQCAKSCPTNNIVIRNGGPVWAAPTAWRASAAARRRPLSTARRVSENPDIISKHFEKCQASLESQDSRDAFLDYSM